MKQVVDCDDGLSTIKCMCSKPDSEKGCILLHHRLMLPSWCTVGHSKNTPSTLMHVGLYHTSHIQYTAYSDTK